MLKKVWKRIVNSLKNHVRNKGKGNHIVFNKAYRASTRIEVVGNNNSIEFIGGGSLLIAL